MGILTVESEVATFVFLHSSMFGKKNVILDVNFVFVFLSLHCGIFFYLDLEADGRRRIMY